MRYRLIVSTLASGADYGSGSAVVSAGVMIPRDQLSERVQVRMDGLIAVLTGNLVIRPVLYDLSGVKRDLPSTLSINTNLTGVRSYSRDPVDITPYLLPHGPVWVRLWVDSTGTGTLTHVQALVLVP